MADRVAKFAGLAAATLVASAILAPAQARVQEYQIIRLLSYKSGCQLARLEDHSASKGPMLFLARCENVSFYPDGIEIRCEDRDDDRSCHLLTKEKTFDSLNLLEQDRHP